MRRRDFIHRTVVGGASLLACRAVVAEERKGEKNPKEANGSVMTVQGLIPATALGLTLSHEHVTTDFLGAEKAAAPRYDQEAALEMILPDLAALKSHGAGTLIECTPNYIGRDVRLLRKLSQRSGLHILTNTGYYGAVDNKYLPRHAFVESEDQLANRWLREWTEGIDGTSVRPGFVKLGVGKGKLPELHLKLMRAGARVHRKTGLTLCVHTGDGEAVLHEMEVLRSEGIAPEALVWVHAQNDPGPIQAQVAERGGWVSLDGYSIAHRNPERYVNLLQALREKDLLHRVLLSHDDGRSVEGNAMQGAELTLFKNGNVRPYESIFLRLIPDLMSAGFTHDHVEQLLRTNPQNAFAMRVRTL